MCTENYRRVAMHSHSIITHHQGAEPRPIHYQQMTSQVISKEGWLQSKLCVK